MAGISVLMQRLAVPFTGDALLFVVVKNDHSAFFQNPVGFLKGFHSVGDRDMMRSVGKDHGIEAIVFKEQVLRRLANAGNVLVKGIFDHLFRNVIDDDPEIVVAHQLGRPVQSAVPTQDIQHVFFDPVVLITDLVEDRAEADAAVERGICFEQGNNPGLCRLWYRLQNR